MLSITRSIRSATPPLSCFLCSAEVQRRTKMHIKVCSRVTIRLRHIGCVPELPQTTRQIQISSPSTPETFYRFCHSEMGHVSRQNDPGVSHLTQVSIASTTSSRLRVGRPPALPSTIPYACALAAEIDTDNNHRNRFLDYARISRKND